MTETRRILTLNDLGKALPRAPAATAPAVASVRRSEQARMNSAGYVVVRSAPGYTISEGAARKLGAGWDSASGAVPRRDFRAAMADASFPPINPMIGMPAPAGLMKLLSDTNNKRILLVGHVFPDHDTVGATLTLARALKLLGKDVDVCIDHELSHTHRRFTAPREIKLAEDLAGKRWDVAIVLDAASSGRIGGARDLLRLARFVSLVDHHKVGQRDDLVSRFRAEETWHDHYDAASLQVCAITEQLLVGRTIDQALLKSIYEPALAGMWTDTAAGTRNIDATTSQYFKYIATKSGASMDDLGARIRFDTPKGLRAAIDYQTGVITRRVLGESLRMKMLSINLASWQKLLSTARAEEPNFGESDLMQVLKGELAAYQHTYGCAALVVQQQSSAVVVARSNDARARLLCDEFRGSGHDGASSATLYGFASFDAALTELERKARRSGVISGL
ncbi:MAG: bifunctional oligoribonuclease/PAP phosphatase NrnA [Myxococcota bacterium]